MQGEGWGRVRWVRFGAIGPRRCVAVAALWARVLNDHVYDPDGRPRGMRRRGEF